MSILHDSSWPWSALWHAQCSMHACWTVIVHMSFKCSLLSCCTVLRVGYCACRCRQSPPQSTTYMWRAEAGHSTWRTSCTSPSLGPLLTSSPSCSSGWSLRTGTPTPGTRRVLHLKYPQTSSNLLQMPLSKSSCGKGFAAGDTYAWHNEDGHRLYRKDQMLVSLTDAPVYKNALVSVFFSS